MRKLATAAVIVLTITTSAQAEDQFGWACSSKTWDTASEKNVEMETTAAFTSKRATLCFIKANTCIVFNHTATGDDGNQVYVSAAGGKLIASHTALTDGKGFAYTSAEKEQFMLAMVQCAEADEGALKPLIDQAVQENQ